MGTQYRDILRLEVAEADLQATLKAGMIGFTNDTFKMGRLSEDGVTMKFWDSNSSTTGITKIEFVGGDSVDNFSYITTDSTGNTFEFVSGFHSVDTPKYQYMNMEAAATEAGSYTIFANQDDDALLTIFSDGKVTIDEGNLLVANKVGIGVTGVSLALEVETALNVTSSFTSTDDLSLIKISDDDTDGYLGVKDSTFTIGMNSSLHAGNLNILSDGKVGIGITNPGNELEVVGTIESTGFVMTTSPTNGYVLTCDASGNASWVIAAGAGEWTLNGNDLYMTPVGYCGIGTATPGVKLDVYHATDDLIGQFTSGDDLCMIKVSDDDTHSYVGSKDATTFIGQTNSLNVANLNILAAGNIGVGVVAPSNMLEVLHATDDTLASFTSSDDLAIIQVSDDDTNSFVGSKDATTFIGQTNSLNVANLCIDATGLIGIGTTNPGAPIDVQNAGELLAKFSSSDDLAYIQVSDDNTNTYVGSKDSTSFIGQNNSLHANNINIVSSGSVGIGTTDPNNTFHVHTSNNVIAKFYSTDDSALIRVEDDDTDSYFGSADATTFIGQTASLNAANLNIDVSGWVGIGSTNPTYPFHVQTSESIIAMFYSTTDLGLIMVEDEDTDSYFGSADSVTTLGQNNSLHANNLNILNSGKVGIGKTDPSYRLDISTTDEIIAEFNSTDQLAMIKISDIAESAETYVGISSSIGFIGLYGSLHEHNINITTGGFIGMGSTSPIYPLDILNSSNIMLRLTSTDDLCMIQMTDNDTTSYFGTKNSITFIGQSDHLTGNNLNVTATAEVGIGVTDPHCKLEVAGAISSGVLVITTANDGAGIDVSAANVIFIDSSAGNISIDDFTGGVNGQFLSIVIKDNTNQVTFTDTSGANQQLILHDQANLVIAAAARAGVHLVCDGSDWYDVSHAKHV